MKRIGCAVLLVLSATGWGIGPATAGSSTVSPAISAGYSYSCALLAAGTVECWGNNEFGQLGRNNTTGSKVPVLVHGVGNIGLLQGVTAISAGSDHTCALLATGDVDCWGANNKGQLGNHTYVGSPVPVPVHGVGNVGLLRGVTAISAGSSSTCAAKASGTLDCWGSDSVGQLGDDKSNGATSVPIRVHGVNDVGFLSGVREMSGGDVGACALLSSGNVVCWGFNGYGELGNNKISNSRLPVRVHGVGNVGFLTGVTAISGDNTHVCALLASGGIDCWGNNDGGELGNNSTGLDSPLPVRVHGAVNGLLSGATAVSAGLAQSCALLAAGTVDCWGYNGSGSLGNDTTADSAVPVPVHGVGDAGLLHGATAISAGSYHACALRTSGPIVCWGSNTDGQLGNNKTVNAKVPVSVT